MKFNISDIIKRIDYEYRIIVRLNQYTYTLTDKNSGIIRLVNNYVDIKYYLITDIFRI
jgi:hypothetical protein